MRNGTRWKVPLLMKALGWRRCLGLLLLCLAPAGFPRTVRSRASWFAYATLVIVLAAVLGIYFFSRGAPKPESPGTTRSDELSPSDHSCYGGAGVSFLRRLPVEESAPFY